jgi:hypothetical protein
MAMRIRSMLCEHRHVGCEEWLGLSKRTAYQAVARGEIPTVKVSLNVRHSADVAAAFVASDETMLV